jgi:hypothetical protein
LPPLARFKPAPPLPPFCEALRRTSPVLLLLAEEESRNANPPAPPVKPAPNPAPPVPPQAVSVLLISYWKLKV